LSRLYTLGPAPTEKSPQEKPRYRSGFSPKQQAIYRRLVEDAWREVCDDPRDARAKDNWYRKTLRDELGVYSSKQLNKSGDFERACAAFEIVAGKSVYWQLRANSGPLERMRRKLKDFVQENDVSEDYLAGISRQMFDTHPSNLDAPKLNKLIAAVKIHLGRHAEAVTAS
jgi:hypothetical protein